MFQIEETNDRLRVDGMDRALTRLYGEDERSWARCARVSAGFVEKFGGKPTALFSAPGRTELGGNHTDHQHGRVLAASVNLDILAAVAVNEDNVIRVYSKDFSGSEVDLSDLSVHEEEKNSTAALIRGVAAWFKNRGCELKGFNAYTDSDVPAGSGLSSSAAFEVLIGTIIDFLFFDRECIPVEVAQCGQYAENVYFGKPSGLLDQMACSVGNIVTIDFADNKNPEVDRVELDFARFGYTLCIVDSGAGHAELTDEYAAVTRELKSICTHFGKEVLREVAEEDFYAELAALRREAGDRAVLRAIHIFEENRRVERQVEALRKKDFDSYLELVRESGLSSWRWLQNLIPTGAVRNQEMAVAQTLCERLLNGKGACRVHGGGFAGTIQAYVPLEQLETFRKGVEAVLGEGSCQTVTIRPVGGVRIV